MQQIVIIDGCKSDNREVKAGVPQHSCLWPFLFIIYINDILNRLESDIFIFADDKTISCSGRDPKQTSDIINRYLDKYYNGPKSEK